MRDKLVHSDDSDTYHARTSGLLPGDRLDRFAFGTSDDSRIIEATYGKSPKAFAENVWLEDLAKQAALPDRFVLKAPTGRKWGGAKR